MKYSKNQSFDVTVLAFAVFAIQQEDEFWPGNTCHESVALQWNEDFTFEKSTNKNFLWQMHFTDRVSTSALLTLSTKYSYYDILDSKFFFFKLGLIGAYEEGKKKTSWNYF